MRIAILCLLLTAAGWCEAWTRHLSPRMHNAFKPMLRSDWDPRKEVELTPQERREFEQVWLPKFRELQQQLQSAPVTPTPRSEAPAESPAPGR